MVIKNFLRVLLVSFLGLFPLKSAGFRDIEIHDFSQIKDDDKEIETLVEKTYHQLVEKLKSLDDIYNKMEKKQLFKIKTDDQVFLNRLHNRFKLFLEKKHNPKQVEQMLKALKDRDIDQVGRLMKIVCNTLPEEIKNIQGIVLLKNFFINQTIYDKKKFLKGFENLAGGDKKKVLQAFSSILLELNYYLDKTPHISIVCCACYAIHLFMLTAAWIAFLTSAVIYGTVPNTHWAWITGPAFLCLLYTLFSWILIGIVENSECRESCLNRYFSIRGQFRTRSVRNNVKDYIKIMGDIKQELLALLTKEEIVIDIPE